MDKRRGVGVEDACDLTQISAKVDPSRKDIEVDLLDGGEVFYADVGTGAQLVKAQGSAAAQLCDRFARRIFGRR